MKGFFFRIRRSAERVLRVRKKEIRVGSLQKSFLGTKKRKIKLKIDAKFMGQIADNKSR